MLLSILYAFIKTFVWEGIRRFYHILREVHDTNKVKNPCCSRWEKCRMLHVEAGSGFAARSVRKDTHGECMFVSKLKNCLMCWPSWFACYVYTTNPFMKQIFTHLIWYAVHLLLAEFLPVTAHVLEDDLNRLSKCCLTVSIKIIHMGSQYWLFFLEV